MPRKALFVSSHPLKIASDDKWKKRHTILLLFRQTGFSLIEKLALFEPQIGQKRTLPREARDIALHRSRKVEKENAKLKVSAVIFNWLGFAFVIFGILAIVFRLN